MAKGTDRHEHRYDKVVQSWYEEKVTERGHRLQRLVIIVECACGDQTQIEGEWE